MTEQLTMIDGRDALAVLIVHPNPDDPAKCEAEIHCNGMDKRQFAQVLYRSALALRDQVLAEESERGAALGEHESNREAELPNGADDE